MQHSLAESLVQAVARGVFWKRGKRTGIRARNVKLGDIASEILPALHSKRSARRRRHGRCPRPAAALSNSRATQLAVRRLASTEHSSHAIKCPRMQELTRATGPAGPVWAARSSQSMSSKSWAAALRPQICSAAASRASARPRHGPSQTRACSRRARDQWRNLAGPGSRTSRSRARDRHPAEARGRAHGPGVEHAPGLGRPGSITAERVRTGHLNLAASARCTRREPRPSPGSRQECGHGERAALSVCDCSLAVAGGL
jgi:hypothetical protein